MMSRLDSNDKNIRFSQSTKKANIAWYFLIRRCVLHSVQSRILLYYQAMTAVPQTLRAFLLPTSVLSVLLAAEGAFPASGTIQTLTTGWCRSESTKVAAQRSSPPRQQKEVHQHREKKREHPCYTNWKRPAPLYCHQLLICIGSHGANQLGLATAAVLFKSFSGLGGYLQALLLQHLFPSQSWRQTSLFPTLKHQSKTLFFPAQPLQLHLQVPVQSEYCRRLMAKRIPERVSMYKEPTTS